MPEWGVARGGGGVIFPEPGLNTTFMGIVYHETVSDAERKPRSQPL